MVSDFRDPEERLRRARDRFFSGRVEEAEQDLRALEALGYHCTDLFLFLGHCAVEKDRLAVALVRYREALRREPDRAEVHLGLGVVAARRLHFRRAVRHLRRAARLDPALAEVWDNLILCHAAIGERRRAEQAFRRSVALDSTSPHPYFNAGFLYFEMGDVVRAKGLWTHVIEVDSDYPDAPRLLASCERRLGELEAARRRLESYLRAAPRDLEGLAELGLVHEDRSEFQSAVEIYRRALEVDPSDTRVRSRLGTLLHKGPDAREGRGGEGLDVLRAVVRSCPDPAAAREARACYLLSAGFPLRAAADYRRLSRLQAESAAPLCGLARALLRAGRREAAHEAAVRAVRRDPESASAFALLAEIEISAGRTRSAQRVLGRARRRRPEDDHLRLLLAECRLREGDAFGAITLAAPVCSAPGEQERIDLLGRAYLAAGDYGRAAELAESALRKNPDDPRGVYLRGRALLATGDFTRAAADLKSYVRARPGDPGGYRELARCLRSQGEPAAAQLQERIARFVAEGP